MRKALKFLGLTFQDQRLLIKTVLLLCAFRLGLSLLSFKNLLSFLNSVKQKSLGNNNGELPSSDQIVWAVEVASRYVPLSTCLTKAITAQLLLAQQGHDTRLHIGVAKSESGKLEAHAWLENQGKIVIGGLNDLSRYAPLSPLRRII